MSFGIELLLATTLAATPPACDWSHPGANPYRGDPVRALADFDLPPATRDTLRALLRAHRPTDTATITRDDIVGNNGSYTDLREMHSGHGRVCHGLVDRSAWSPRRRERALVYCADDACVIVPAICHNVSLVSRKNAQAAEGDGPIDIEPAAGPPHADSTPELPETAPTPDEGPLGFVPTPEGGGGLPGAPGGGDGGTAPGGPIAGAPLPGGPIDGLPPIVDGGDGPDAPPIGGGGDGPPDAIPPIDGGYGPPADTPPLLPPPVDGPCCGGTPPGPPVGPLPPETPPITPVPEPPAWLLLLAGLAALRAPRRRGARRA